MKVLHNFRKYLPVSENWAYRLIEHTPNTSVHIHAEKLESNNFFNPNWTFSKFSYSDLQDLYEQLDKKKISDLPAKILLKTNLLKKVEKLKYQKFTDYIESQNINIVHSHFGPMAIKYHPYVKTTNALHVISFYGYDYEKSPHVNSAILSQYKKLFKEADAFICEGSHGARTLEKYGCPKKKIFIVPLGLSPLKIRPTPKSKKRNSLRLVQIATITEKKGHIYTIEAFARAIKDCPNMDLTLIGRKRSNQFDWITERIEQVIAENNLQKKVKLVDQIDFSVLYEYLSQFDVFIHPSCYAKDMDCEGGAPVVLLDAQSIGLPIISTTHCDIPDEVIHEKTGLLSAEKNVKELTESIKKFYLMEEDIYKDYSKNAIFHVRQNYNIKDSGITLSKIYQKLINIKIK